MSNVPEWIASLNSRGFGNNQGIEFLSDAERQELAEDISPSLWQHYKPGAEERAQTTLAEGVPFARAPLVDCGDGVKLRPVLWGKRDEPGRIWLQLSHEHPPDYWLAIDADSRALADVLSDYDGSAPGPDDELRELQVCLGAVPALGEIENYLVMSGYTDMMGLLGTTPAGMERFETKGITGCTWRTCFSRSRLSLEIFNFDVGGAYPLVGEIHYRPRTPNPAIAALNERYGLAWPSDLPVDVAGALEPFPCLTKAQVRGHLDGDLSRPEAIALVFALTYMVDDYPATLRELMAHDADDVRLAAGYSARAFQQGEIQAEMLEREGNPDIRATLQELFPG